MVVVVVVVVVLSHELHWGSEASLTKSTWSRAHGPAVTLVLHQIAKFLLAHTSIYGDTSRRIYYYSIDSTLYTILSGNIMSLLYATIYYYLLLYTTV